MHVMLVIIVDGVHEIRYQRRNIPVSKFVFVFSSSLFK